MQQARKILRRRCPVALSFRCRQLSLSSRRCGTSVIVGVVGVAALLLSTIAHCSSDTWLSNESLFRSLPDGLSSYLVGLSASLVHQTLERPAPGATGNLVSHRLEIDVEAVADQLLPGFRTAGRNVVEFSFRISSQHDVDVLSRRQTDTRLLAYHAVSATHHTD